MDVYFADDQPTTCPKCGNRTNIIIELTDIFLTRQFHRCLSKYCIFDFIVETELDE